MSNPTPYDRNLIRMSKATMENYPKCYGTFSDCKACFYNHVYQCEYKTVELQGHTHECAMHLVTIDGLCICGKDV